MRAMRLMLALTLALALLLPLTVSGEAAVYSHLGEAMPDFTVTTIDGSTFTLSEVLQEKDMVLINLWATWCGPCRMEFPYMEAAYEMYQDKVEIIALTVEPTDDDATLTAFAAEYGMTFPIGHDSDVGLGDIFATVGIPTTLVVDRFGNIAFITIGSEPSLGSFTRLFDAFIGEGYTESIVLDGIPAAMPNIPNASEAELAAALNVEGGELAFVNSEDASVWPFVPAEVDGRSVLASSNVDDAGTTSAVYTTVNAADGDALAFAFKTSTEVASDLLQITINGETVKSFGGEHDWTDWAIALNSSENTIGFLYVKDDYSSDGEDKVWIDDVRILSGDEAAAALASLPVYPVAEEVSVMVLNPDAKELIFDDPEGVMAEYFGCDTYWLVPTGEADVAVTITADMDVETTFVYNNYDGLIVSLLEILPESGNVYVYTGGIDTMETTGYPYCNVYLYSDMEVAGGAMLFVDEPNVNALVDMLAEDGAVVTWTYADGAAPTTTEIATGENPWAEYEVYFIDQNGDAVPGCFINFCTDETCVLCVADENGIATFSGVPYPYHLQVIHVPDGYTFDTAQEFYADEAGGEMTIVVEKNAE